jgi:hypothetical protein
MRDRRLKAVILLGVYLILLTISSPADALFSGIQSGPANNILPRVGASLVVLCPDSSDSKKNIQTWLGQLKKAFHVSRQEEDISGTKVLAYSRIMRQQDQNMLQKDSSGFARFIDQTLAENPNQPIFLLANGNGKNLVMDWVGNESNEKVAKHTTIFWLDTKGTLRRKIMNMVMRNSADEEIESLAGAKRIMDNSRRRSQWIEQLFKEMMLLRKPNHLFAPSEGLSSWQGLFEVGMDWFFRIKRNFSAMVEKRYAQELEARFKSSLREMTASYDTWQEKDIELTSHQVDHRFEKFENYLTRGFEKQKKQAEKTLHWVKRRLRKNSGPILGPTVLNEMGKQLELQSHLLNELWTDLIEKLEISRGRAIPILERITGIYQRRRLSLWSDLKQELQPYCPANEHAVAIKGRDQPNSLSVLKAWATLEERRLGWEMLEFARQEVLATLVGLTGYVNEKYQWIAAGHKLQKKIEIWEGAWQKLGHPLGARGIDGEDLLYGYALKMEKMMQSLLATGNGAGDHLLWAWAALSRSGMAEEYEEMLEYTLGKITAAQQTKLLGLKPKGKFVEQKFQTKTKIPAAFGASRVEKAGIAEKALATLAAYRNANEKYQAMRETMDWMYQGKELVAFGAKRECATVKGETVWDHVRPSLAGNRLAFLTRWLRADMERSEAAGLEIAAADLMDLQKNWEDLARKKIALQAARKAYAEFMMEWQAIEAARNYKINSWDRELEPIRELQKWQMKRAAYLLLSANAQVPPNLIKHEIADYAPAKTISKTIAERTKARLSSATSRERYVKEGSQSTSRGRDYSEPGSELDWHPRTIKEYRIGLETIDAQILELATQKQAQNKMRLPPKQPVGINRSRTLTLFSMLEKNFRALQQNFSPLLCQTDLTPFRNFKKRLPDYIWQVQQTVELAKRGSQAAWHKGVLTILQEKMTTRKYFMGSHFLTKISVSEKRFQEDFPTRHITEMLCLMSGLGAVSAPDQSFWQLIRQHSALKSEDSGIDRTTEPTTQQLNAALLSMARWQQLANGLLRQAVYRNIWRDARDILSPGQSVPSKGDDFRMQAEAVLFKARVELEKQDLENQEKMIASFRAILDQAFKKGRDEKRMTVLQSCQELITRLKNMKNHEANMFGRLREKMSHTAAEKIAERCKEVSGAKITSMLETQVNRLMERMDLEQREKTLNIERMLANRIFSSCRSHSAASGSFAGEMSSWFGWLGKRAERLEQDAQNLLNGYCEEAFANGAGREFIETLGQTIDASRHWIDDHRMELRTALGQSPITGVIGELQRELDLWEQTARPNKRVTGFSRWFNLAEIAKRTANRIQNFQDQVKSLPNPLHEWVSQIPLLTAAGGLKKQAEQLETKMTVLKETTIFGMSLDGDFGTPPFGKGTAILGSCQTLDAWLQIDQRDLALTRGDCPAAMARLEQVVIPLCREGVELEYDFDYSPEILHITDGSGREKSGVLGWRDPLPGHTWVCAEKGSVYENEDVVLIIRDIVTSANWRMDWYADKTGVMRKIAGLPERSRRNSFAWENKIWREMADQAGWWSWTRGFLGTKIIGVNWDYWQRRGARILDRYLPPEWRHAKSLLSFAVKGEWLQALDRVATWLLPDWRRQARLLQQLWEWKQRIVDAMRSFKKGNFLGGLRFLAETIFPGWKTGRVFLGGGSSHKEETR